jgi:hypothetical protein
VSFQEPLVRRECVRVLLELDRPVIDHHAIEGHYLIVHPLPRLQLPDVVRLAVRPREVRNLSRLL